MAKNKTPWMKGDKFKIQTCKTLASYLESKTGIKPEVHKTEMYLVVNYLKDGALNTEKLLISAGVLYCFKQEDFDPLIEKMNKKTGDPDMKEIARQIAIFTEREDWRSLADAAALMCIKAEKREKGVK